MLLLIHGYNQPASNQNRSQQSTSQQRCRGWKSSFQLEQLDHLHSKNTPAAPWLPILSNHIGSLPLRQILAYLDIQKEARTWSAKSWSDIIRQQLKFWNWRKTITLDTRSAVSWQDMQIWNWSDLNFVRYRADTTCCPPTLPTHFIDVG